MGRSSVEALQISHISENTPDNLNNFISLCPIGTVFHLAWSPQCALQFIPYNHLAPMSPSGCIPLFTSFKLAKLTKILPITSITSSVCVRSESFFIWHGALGVLYNSS